MRLTKKEAKKLGLVENVPAKATQQPVARRQPTAASLSIPRAGRAERTGLSTLIRLGWSVQSPDSVRHRLYVIGRPDLDTGLCADELTACLAAKALEQLR